MRIQLDYDTKVLKLESNINLGDFVKKIKTILPDWKKWKLETNTVIQNWANPIYIETYSYPWWNQPFLGAPSNEFIGTPDFTLTTGYSQVEPEEGMFFINIQ